ncbi:MAG: Uma2 family endonuclease [Anaerolineae bacterium]
MDTPREKLANPLVKLSFQEFLKQFDGKHAEWLMGDVILVSNNLTHIKIFKFLIALLEFYLGLKPIGELIVASFTMYVGDDKPAREPDLMIVMNENAGRIKQTFLDGAADIAIEIVSPESELRDYKTKMREYAAVGVREYWIVDPQEKQAFINALNAQGEYDQLPLNSEGKLISGLLPGFALDPTLLWGEELPKGAALIALVQGMVG